MALKKLSNLNQEGSCDVLKLSKFSYWQKRYQDQHQDLGFDWFITPADILEHILDILNQVKKKHVNKSLHLLDLGCGTSDLSLNVLAHTSSPVSMILLDFVKEALLYQRKKFSKISQKGSSVQFVCADILNIPFCNNSFDLIIDKGTMDALLKDSTNGQFKCEVMMSEVMRVLSKYGRYMQISDEDPDSRLLCLEEICHKAFTSSHKPNSISHELDHKKLTSDSNLELWEERNILNKVTYKDGNSLQEKIQNHTDSSSFDPHHCHSLERSDITSWSFEVVSSHCGREYFIYWFDKLR
ncbi:citrate synthase-lysine N-methyltransferase CSKMT, mitochondrial-like isoform X2 [Physella acuta]|uniref:citrate synthase-lysine N-methyltransferase CSKMT, mitochondrial-like isoform X2 n=1 Tax=Physella acuta TaxID=109671 RepID=UPI0027DE0BC9|nr:citrate synthase-lysine N-methyltransferase CSKMT, mitochondrial-like isoform X2 [Physella acuta]